MRKLLAVVLSCVSFAASAGWNVEKKIDAMTDQEKKSAVVTNAMGHKLSIYRLQKDGAVWANFSLADGNFDTLGNKVFMLRIDKNPPESIQDDPSMKRLGLNIFQWEPKWINWQVWHGKSDEGLSTLIKQMMSGSTLIIRYPLGTGGTKDATFDIRGSAQALAEALDISADPNNAQEQVASDIHSFMVSQIKACPISPIKEALECRKRITGCVTSNKGDLEMIKVCVGQ